MNQNIIKARNSIQYRIEKKIHLFKAKLNHKTETQRVNKIKFDPIIPWNDLAALPGDSSALKDLNHRSKIVSNEFELFKHNWPVLSNKSINLNLPTSFSEPLYSKLSSVLGPDEVKSYKRIDWHKDHLSGFRWDPNKFYLQVRDTTSEHADIKVPWELSRFHHAPLIFETTSQKGSKEFLLQIFDWIEANPVRKGVNWSCTMDVGLRAISWIWILRVHENELKNYPKLLNNITQSLYEHGLHIYHNLEYHYTVTNNHYLSNITGLLFISCTCPQFEESDHWLIFCIQELESEMNRQVLDDGFADEGSTSYHRLVTELFTTCTALIHRIPESRFKKLRDCKVKRHDIKPKLSLSGEEIYSRFKNEQLFPKNYYQKLLKMGRVIDMLTQPNGETPSVGDNDSGRAQKLTLETYNYENYHGYLAETVKILLGIKPDKSSHSSQSSLEARIVAGNLLHPINLIDSNRIVENSLLKCENDKPLVVILPNAGIGRLCNKSFWVLMSAGPAGHKGLGGHNHNDKLSVVISFQNENLIIDPGCATYSNDIVKRNWYRSTEQHNTLIVEGTEQDYIGTSPKHLFKLKQISNPSIWIDEDMHPLKAESNSYLIGKHSGYIDPHKRKIWLESDSLFIEDEFPCNQINWLHFNLAPGVTIEKNTPNDAIFNRQELETLNYEPGLDECFIRATISTPNGRNVELTMFGCDELIIQDSLFSPGYGKEAPIKKIKIRRQAKKTLLMFVGKI